MTDARHVIPYDLFDADCRTLSAHSYIFPVSFQHTGCTNKTGGI